MSLWIWEGSGLAAVPPVAVPVEVVFAVVGVILLLDPDLLGLPVAPVVARVDVVFAAVGFAAVGVMVVAVGAVAAAAGMV